MVCQELTERRDFDALVNLSRVSRGIADVGLPLLYR